MENASNETLATVVRGIDGLDRQDLGIAEVGRDQIIRALNREIGISFAQGFLYEVVQAVANEARNRGLLINPNQYTRQTYSTAVGNTNRMLPSARGWEMTKGILTRHLMQARDYLRDIVAARNRITRGRSSTTLQTNPPALGT